MHYCLCISLLHSIISACCVALLETGKCSYDHVCRHLNNTSTGSYSQACHEGTHGVIYWKIFSAMNRRRDAARSGQMVIIQWHSMLASSQHVSELSRQQPATTWVQVIAKYGTVAVGRSNTLLRAHNVSWRKGQVSVRCGSMYFPRCSANQYRQAVISSIVHD